MQEPQETRVLSLSREDPLEKEMETRVLSLSREDPLEKEMAALPVFLRG